MPKVFQIGLSGWGTRWLRRVFREAGHVAVSGERERIAADICYAARTGGVPLAKWPEVQLFTDMESARSSAEPPLHGEAEFELLHHHFPDAYFLLNLGDVEAWLRARAARSGGRYLHAAASVLDVDEATVPAVWRRRWVEHARAATDHFAGHERFAAFDLVTEGLPRLADFLAADFDLSAPSLPPAPPPPRQRAPKQWAAVTLPPRASSPGGRGSVSSELVSQVVDFATRTEPAVPPGMPWRTASRFYAHWDGRDRVRGRYGRTLRCAVDLRDPRWPFLFDEPLPKHRRTEGTLNELWQHGGRRGAHVDMQDARRYGVKETGAPASPVLTFCRLVGAANLVLWPLPGYHTPGAPDFPGKASADRVDPADKLDSLAWRGNLSGRTLPELGPAGQVDRHASRLAAELGTGHDDEVLAALATVPRFRVLSRLAGRADMDLGLVLGERWRDAQVPAQIARLVRPRMGYDEIFRHRYLLSVSGNDSASNFLMVADSRSVVLREEDGWEWFYDGQFRPWEHYIPVARGGDDIEERLEWARAHPRECEDMSRRARQTVRLLVHPDNRRAYLGGIREVYESRFTAS